MTSLEKAANVATIVVAILISTFVALRLTADVPSPEKAPLAFSPGESFPNLEGIPFGRNEPSRLFIAVRDGCRYCEESIEFYKKLSAYASESRLSVVGVCPSTTEECVGYFRKRSISVGSALGVSGRDLPVRGTPTLVLVSGVGVVVNSWEGKLSREKEEEVLTKATDVSR